MKTKTCPYSQGYNLDGREITSTQVKSNNYEHKNVQVLIN